MQNYFIDLGSSTIKVYCYENELKLIDEHSIYFKNDFDAEKGISESNLKELCDYFEELKSKYNLKYYNTHVFVTGIFRNLIQERKQDLVKLFNRVVRKLKMWYNLSAGYERRKLESSLYGVTLIHI